MRIKELAELTGSTIRAIRYYHQIGLLPIPQRRYGSRDYDMVHVARLVRVRWLAQAGVPLVKIAAMLDDHSAPEAMQGEPGPASVLADLQATVAALDEQLLDLQRQRDRIRRLITAVERDGLLSPMPAAMVRFYETMRARATDENVRRVIRRERDFMELAFYRGDMPPESAVLYEGLTDAGLAQSFELFGEIAARAGREALTDAEIDQIAGAVVDRITRHLGAAADKVFSSIDLDVARRAADLFLRLSDPRQRRLDRAIADALLAAIEKGQNQ